MSHDNENLTKNRPETKNMYLGPKHTVIWFKIVKVMQR